MHVPIVPLSGGLPPEALNPPEASVQSMTGPAVQAELVAAADAAQNFIAENNPRSGPTEFLRPQGDRYKGVSDTTKELASVAKRHGLRVAIEQPVPWLRGEGGGIFTRELYGHIFVCLSALGIQFSARPTDKSKTFSPRRPGPKELVFSFHSADNTLERGGEIVPNVWRIKESVFPPFYTFDRTGFNGWAEIAISDRHFKSSEQIESGEAMIFASELRRWVTERGVTKYRQSADVALPFDDPYVLHAMQISTDTVMKLAKIPHGDLARMLAETAGREGVPLVIKRHPKCGDDRVTGLLEELSTLPYVHISDSSIHSLIGGAQSVVVINSGVGFEALIHDKPVYTAGPCEYRWGSNPVRRKSDLVEAFREPRRVLDPIRLAQFLTYYFRDYCVNASDPFSVERHVARSLAQWLYDSGVTTPST